MRILFIYKFEYLEPLGIMSLAAYLKQNGHQCHFVDLELEKNYLSKIKQLQPDIIAYSITTGRHRFYQQLNLKLKKQQKFSAVFGGPHATFFPEFINQEGVDIICRGEGEQALLELANLLHTNDRVKHIQNLWVKQDNQIFKNELRPLIQDLDDLPFPDRELINIYPAYRKMQRRQIMTSRGCAFNCTYCFNHVYKKLYPNQNPVRRRSPNNVLQELLHLKQNFKPKRFHFLDDNFVTDENWCTNFFKQYCQQIKLPFIVHTRVNNLTKNIVSTLKTAGCQTVLYAIESGNSKIRQDLLKRNTSDQQILMASSLLKKYKLKTYVQNMVGLPTETITDALQTIELNKKCRPDYAWCSIFQPYPMTDLWAFCKKNNLLSNQEPDESYYQTSVLNLKPKLKRQFINLHHLFSIAVGWKIPLPTVKFLIQLPMTKLYFLIWQIHRAWCYVFKVKWINFSEIFLKLK